MTQAGRRLIAAAKENAASIRAHAQEAVAINWDMGQARTCLNCGGIFLTKKNLRIHRAIHRTTETKCARTATT